MAPFIKNPLLAAKVDDTNSNLPKGVRGLLAGDDGWYDIDDTGEKQKLLTIVDASGLTEEQLSNINKIPEIEDSLLTKISYTKGYESEIGSYLGGEEDVNISSGHALRRLKIYYITSKNNPSSSMVLEPVDPYYLIAFGYRTNAFSLDDEGMVYATQILIGGNNEMKVRKGSGSDWDKITWSECSKFATFADLSDYIKTEALSEYQEKLSDEQLTNINNVPEIKSTANSAIQLASQAMDEVGNVQTTAENALSVANSKQEKLSDEQIADINKIPDIEETANIAAQSAKFAQEVASQALDDASFAKENIESLQVEVTFAKNQADAANAKANDAYTKAETAQSTADSIISEYITVLNNKTQVLSLQMETKQDKPTVEYIDTTEISFNFDERHNNVVRCTNQSVEYIQFNFGVDAYDETYYADISFNSGVTPTDIGYILIEDVPNPQLINWVGTDCTLDYYENDDGQLVPVSIFQPSANMHYDIVFYFNGEQMIGLVNGFVPASGNVVSE